MKKLFSVLLSLLAVLALTTGAFAEENPFIVDELDRLEDGVQAELNDRAKGLKETYGLDVYLAYVKGHADDAAPETIVGESTDYVLLLMGERGTRIYSGGKGPGFALQKLFTDDDINIASHLAANASTFEEHYAKVFASFEQE